VLGTWGPDGTRPAASATYWRQPDKWDDEARDAGRRARVFCGSMMDIFEARTDLLEPRQRVWNTVYRTGWLDWLLLTKRPQNIPGMLPQLKYGPGWPPKAGWPHVWLGTTVEDQKRADERIPALCAVPAAVRFLSCEPLLEPLDLSHWLATGGVHWVIVGGESAQGGRPARPFELGWCEEVVNQCRDAGVPCFVKQMGSRPLTDGLGLRLKDRHGGDEAEWPEWLRVRQLPVRA
jgi:protein gp37